MKKVLFISFLSIFAFHLALAQEKNDHDFEKGTLIPVSKYYGAELPERLSFKSANQNNNFTTLFSNGFEADTGQWDYDGIWEIGTPTSGPNNGYNSTNAAGTNLSGNYSSSVNDTLISPTINLTANANEDVFLEFFEWFKLESNHDYGFVIVSTDSGETWTTIHERSGQTEWVFNQLSLNNFKNEDVNIGFVISTDDTHEFEGWYLDDVEITVRAKDELGVNISSLNTREFPFVYLNVEVDTFGVGIPTLGPENFMLTENGIIQEDFFELTPPEESGQVRLADIVFIMDNSGSMGGEQQAVNDNVNAFVDSLKASGVDFSLGLTRYGSRDNGGRPIFVNDGNLTSDADNFINNIWSQNNINGGHEPGYRSIQESVNQFNFRPGAQKIFIIITDETPNQDNITVEQAQQALQDNSVTLFALTQDHLFSTFVPLVSDPEEQLFNIFEPFDDILSFIVETVSNSYVISYRSSEPTKDGVRRRVQVQVNYDGKQSIDNTSYVPGSAPDIKRSRSTILYSAKAWGEGTPFDINIEVRDEVEPFVNTSTLFYRTTGTEEYTSVEMQNDGDGAFSATIPTGFAERPGVDYYITSTDGESNTSAPKVNPSEDPYQIPILPNRAPNIIHAPVVNSSVGNDILIEATVTDETNELEAVTLFYRQLGQLSFTGVEMDYEGSDVFEQVIPGEIVTSGGVEYFIEAEDDLGTKSWAPGSPDDPSFISTGDVIDITLTRADNGPKPANIEVPRNGSGYIYYKINNDDEEDIFIEDYFNLGLEDVINEIEYTTSAQFIKENLLQIEVPYSILSTSATTNFQLNQRFNIGDHTYSIGSQGGIFTALPEEQSFTRTWSVYASGSAGISGTIGGVGVGASIAAAKASISGTGGVGLGIEANETGELSMTRRMDAGVASAVSVPGINPIVGSVKPGVSSNLMVKAMAGQKVRFSRIADSDLRAMAQTGYLLETLSLGGAAVSPYAGVVLNATIRTINNLSNVSSQFDAALVEQFGGIGLEGSINANTGRSFEFKSFKFAPAEATVGFVLNANYYQYPFGLPENNSVTTSAEITTAVNFDLSALSWDLGNEELSVLTTGAGSEVGMAGFWTDTGQLDHLEFFLSNGANIDLLLPTRSIYQTSTVHVPAEYASTLFGMNSVLSGFIEPANASVPFGNSIAGELNNNFNALNSGIDNKNPLVVTNTEKRGRGYAYDFKASFDAAFAAGAGIDIGLGLQLHDEIAYSKSKMEVYNGGENYIVSSSTFDQSMESRELTETLEELFSGTIPLLQQAWSNLVSNIDETIEAGSEFIFNAVNTGSKFVGSVRGVLQQSGEFLVSVYSPKSSRIQQKGFNAPEIRNLYISPNVLHKVKGKSGNQSVELVNAGSELIVISDVINLAFIPEGSSTPVEALNSAVELQMEVREQDLLDSDFTMDDIDRVDIYRYDLDTNSWVRMNGNLDENILSADITIMGEYALGIELNRANDSKKPEIYEYGFNKSNAETNPNQIFAKIRDDRYGTGIDFSKTYVFLNDDTLDYTYQPASERIFYTISDSDNLNGSAEIVRVEVADFNGNVAVKSFTFETSLATGIEDETAPNKFELLDNYPNPFNPQTNISFKLPEAAHVQINVYDVLGRFVETLLNERVEAGTHTVPWKAASKSGRELSTGVYFYQIKAGDFNQVKKMMFLK